MSDEKIDNSRGQAYLASLGVVAVLLIGFLDGGTGGWGVTDPRWVGMLGNVLYSVGWYMLFATVIQIIVTFAVNYLFDLPLQAILPTVMTFVSLLLYLVMALIQAFYTYRGPPVYNATIDNAAYPPRDMWGAYFVAEVVPLILSLLFIVGYTGVVCSIGLLRQRHRSRSQTTPEEARPIVTRPRVTKVSRDAVRSAQRR